MTIDVSDPATWRLSSPKDTSDVLNAIFDEMERLGASDTREPERLCRALVPSLRAEAQKVTSLSDRVVRQFIQFQITIGPLVQATRERRFADAFDLVSLGLSNNEDEGVGEIEVTRFDEFLEADVLPPMDAVIGIIEWGEGFWYLARAHATYDGAAEALLPLFVRLAQNYERFPLAPSAAFGFAADWLVEHGRSTEVGPFAAVLLSRFEDDSNDLTERVSAAAFVQGRVGEAAGIGRERAVEFLAKHAPPQVHFQVKVQDWLLGSDRGIEGILDSATVVLQELEGPAGVAGREVFFRVLHPVLVRLAEFGDAKTVLRLLATWRGAREPIDEAHVLVPNAGGGSLLVEPSGSVSTGPVLDIDAFILAVNEFWQSTMTIIGRKMQLYLPERRDVVAPHNGGRAYEQALLNIFDGVSLTCDEYQSLAWVPVEAHPVQAVGSRHGHGMCPWSVSYQRPRPDPQSRRAIILACDAMMAQLEAEPVRASLIASGWNVEYVAPDAVSIQVLRDAWENASYDLIWVSSHGDSGGLRPDDAHLVLGAERVGFISMSFWEALSCSAKPR